MEVENEALWRLYDLTHLQGPHFPLEGLWTEVCMLQKCRPTQNSITIPVMILEKQLKETIRILPNLSANDC